MVCDMKVCGSLCAILCNSLYTVITQMEEMCGRVARGTSVSACLPVCHFESDCWAIRWPLQPCYPFCVVLYSKGALHSLVSICTIICYTTLGLGFIDKIDCQRHTLSQDRVAEFCTTHGPLARSQNTCDHRYTQPRTHAHARSMCMVIIHLLVFV